jgi:hypothetical protein
MIHFVLPAANEWTAREYFSKWGRSVAGRFRVLRYEDLAAKTSFDRGTYLLTGFFPRRLQPLMEELHRQLSAVEGIRFVNHPTRTLRRFELLEELYRRGWNGFRAVRLATADVAALRYPIFLRSEEEHSGALSPLLRSPSEIDGALGKALWQGYRLDDLLAVEFCDTADAEGFYRKYSAYIVGDRILARAIERGRGWMLKHARAEFTEATILAEREFIVTNPHEAELRKIFEIAGTEFGRIDYGIQNGRIQTWEINLLPAIGRGQGERRHAVVPSELEPLRDVGKRHFYRGFAEAWEAVDLPSDRQPPVQVALSPALRAPGRARPVRRGGPLRALRQMLRPLKPLLEPFSRPVYPLITRLARRRRV